MSIVKANTFQSVTGGRPVITGGALCLAWVNFNGITGVIRSSFNVTTVTKNSTGDYVINFTTPMTDINYVIGGSASQNNGGNGYALVAQKTYETAPTTSAVRIATIYSASNNPIDCNYVSVMIFGN
jgi:hypothetical protein